MAETFFGPWQITIGQVNSHFLQSFTIVGSEDTDGRYHLAFGDRTEIIAQGEAWTIQIEWFPFAADANYQPSDVRRTTKFVWGQGLVVQLDADANAPDSPNPTYDNLTLICTSLDSEINPFPTITPYDFTIHGR